MKDVIVEYTGKLGRDEEAGNCFSSCCMATRVHKLDGMWSWVVCVAGILSNVLVLGSPYTFGVIFPTLLDELNEGKAKTALIGSIVIAATGLFGPVAGKLIDRYGCRMVAIFGSLTCAVGLVMTSQAPCIAVMYITYSGIFGLGSACVYTSVFVIVPKYFVKRCSFAIGLITAAPGVSLFTMSPLVNYFLDQFGYKGVFVGQAILCTLIPALACTFDPNVESNGEDYEVKLKEIEEDKTDWKAKLKGMFSFRISFWKNPEYLIFAFSAAVVYFGLFIPIVHMARHSEGLGISSERSAQLYFYYGLMATITRVAVGKVCDFSIVSPQQIYRAATLISGTATVLVPLATTYSGLLAYFVVFGLAEGFIATPMNILLLSVLAHRHRAQGYGFAMLIICAVMAFGPPFAGFLADEFGSYAPAFYVAGSIMISGSVITLLLPCFKPSDSKLLLQDNSSLGEELIVIQRESVL